VRPDERTDFGDLNPTGRFSDRAEDYRRYRPDYPAAALDAILEGLGDPSRLTAADIGAGTGISSRQLAARGVRVLAVEPNAGMRAAAGPHDRIEWREGTAEATGLAAGGVGLVLCAQAFHWFRAPAALAEFHRILGPGGRLALMWNSRDRADRLTRGYIEAIHAVNGEHPVEQIPFEPANIATGGLFTAPRETDYAHAQTLDREGLIGRATSASYVPREGEPLERLRAMLVALWERERDARGMVMMRYVTKVFLAERRQAALGRRTSQMA
jgi:SAM-dependent methyltransferase